jgi:hypothetical protein
VSLFAGPAEHTANPPESWTIVKRGERSWALVLTNGDTLDTFPSKRAAVEATETGRYVELYRKESRWYAGESIPGWKPYAVLAGELARA